VSPLPLPLFIDSHVGAQILFGRSVLPSKPIHAYILQVIILANHMNGKDTHVRGMRILGPTE
jgi:Anaphase-promoting complex, subunit 10 (APC10)